MYIDRSTAAFTSTCRAAPKRWPVAQRSLIEVRNFAFRAEPRGNGAGDGGSKGGRRRRGRAYAVVEGAVFSEFGTVETDLNGRQAGDLTLRQASEWLLDKDAATRNNLRGKRLWAPQKPKLVKESVEANGRALHGMGREGGRAKPPFAARRTPIGLIRTNGQHCDKTWPGLALWTTFWQSLGDAGQIKKTKTKKNRDPSSSSSPPRPSSIALQVLGGLPFGNFGAT